MRPHFYSRQSTDLARYALENRGDGGSGPRLVIIGVGMMGREHLRVAALLGRARLRGICDASPDSIRLALADCAAHGVAEPLVYDSLDAACADPHADAYMVCTPNFSHWNLFEGLLATGKPIFLEKPMATSLAEARRMVDIARDYPGLVQLGMQYRFKAQYVDAFHEVQSQQVIGPVKTIAMAEYRPPFLDKVGQWNKFNRYSGGTLVEKCCHYFDLINQMAAGIPIKVYAQGGRAVNFLDFEQDGERSDIDDHAFVSITYDNGTLANFTLNMFSQELYEELVVTGPGGRVVASEQASFRPGVPSSAHIKVETPDHPAYRGLEVTYPDTIERSGHSGATFFEHLAWVTQLEGGEADAATPLQGFWSLVVASAAQQSLTSGEVILIDEFCAGQGITLPSHG